MNITVRHRTEKTEQKTVREFVDREKILGDTVISTPSPLFTDNNDNNSTVTTNVHPV